MIDITTLRSLIETFCTANCTKLPLVKENASIRDRSDVHMEIFIVDSDSEKMEAGSPVHLITGYLIFGINVKKGSGSAFAREVAQEASGAVLEEDAIPGLKLSEPIFAGVGPLDGVDLYRYNLTFKIRYFYGQANF